MPAKLIVNLGWKKKVINRNERYNKRKRLI